MGYSIRMEEIAPQMTAVVHAQARQDELSTVVPALCGEVWSYLTSSGLPKGGRHTALYKDMVMNIEVGCEVFAPFPGDGRVVPSTLPGGTVVTTTHIGDYSGITNAHMAIHEWCAENGHTPTYSWEIYGHMDDPSAPPRTDIYCLLQTL